MSKRYEIWVASRWAEAKEGPYHYADTRQPITETQIENLRMELAQTLNIGINKIRFVEITG